MSEKQHYLRPLQGRRTNTRHLLLWIDVDESALTLTPLATRVWDMIDAKDGIDTRCAGSWAGIEELEAILDGATKGKGILHVWLCRGWEDLVLSGLAELIDKNICQWRYAMLDGQRLIVRGLWRGRPIVICSLANWTGGRWNAWPQVLEDVTCQGFLAGCEALAGDGGDPPSPAEEIALATWCAICRACRTLRCNRMGATAASAALQIWRRWLGLRLTVERPPNGQKRRHKANGTIDVICPVPFRPRKAALAERHSCYGHIAHQLRQGFVNETIYVLDVSGAYLLALCTIPLPLRQLCTLHRPHPQELAQLMADGTAHALVRIDTTEYSYPVRRQGRVMQALGHYWTWLSGHELANALVAGHAKEVYTAYAWSAAQLPPERAQAIMSIADAAKQQRHFGLAACWRSIYSSLVGYYAARRREWTDVAVRPGYERWCEWQRAETDTGRIVQCRSIAGRHQELRQRSDTSAAVPLLFSLVCSFVHWMVQELARVAGLENVVQMHADSVWLTQPGWQATQRRASSLGIAPDNLKVKAVYDRGWFTGRTICVVERDGKRYLRTPGISSNAVIDASGRVCRPAAIPWSQAESVRAADGCKRTLARYPGSSIVDRYGYPALWLSLGEPLDDPLLPPDLLQAAHKERTIEDE